MSSENSKKAFSDQEWERMKSLAEGTSIKDRQDYFQALIDKGDTYGGLAMGVVNQDDLFGRFPVNYAIEMSNLNGMAVDAEKCIRLFC